MKIGGYVFDTLLIIFNTLVVDQIKMKKVSMIKRLNKNSLIEGAISAKTEKERQKGKKEWCRVN